MQTRAPQSHLSSIPGWRLLLHQDSKEDSPNRIAGLTGVGEQVTRSDGDCH